MGRGIRTLDWIGHDGDRSCWISVILLRWGSGPRAGVKNEYTRLEEWPWDWGFIYSLSRLCLPRLLPLFSLSVMTSLCGHMLMRFMPTRPINAQLYFCTCNLGLDMLRLGPLKLAPKNVIWVGFVLSFGVISVGTWASFVFQIFYQSWEQFFCRNYPQGMFVSQTSEIQNFKVPNLRLEM